MQVQFMKAHSDHVAVVWRIADRGRSYAAQWSVKTGGWTLRSLGNGKPIPADGKRGRQIIAAIEAHKGN